jgi:hypothetical protein
MYNFAGDPVESKMRIDKSSFRILPFMINRSPTAIQRLPGCCQLLTLAFIFLHASFYASDPQ